MDLQHYLARIGYRGGTRPDLAALIALQQSHICSVPFENLDVQLGRRLTTDVGAAYEKIVTNGRGGWCYEQNGLFGWALSEFGFNVTRLAADVMRQDRGDSAKANHLCLLVSYPGSTVDYLVDVGFGGSMIEPIRLAESEYAQPPFRIGLRRLEDSYWRFWENIGNGEFSFDFVAEPASEVALARKCEVLQTDPSSVFTLNLVAQLRSRDQHSALRGRVLTTATQAGVKSRTLDSADALVTTLAKRFHLDVPEVANLWPRIAARHEEYLHTRNDS